MYSTIIQGGVLTFNRESGFAKAFKKLIIERVHELVNDIETIAVSVNSADYKRREMDKRLDMLEHNFNVYQIFFKMKHGQQENILQNMRLLYRMQ